VQVVILAGGLGSRLAEETVSIPKPMVSVGPDPILLHIMRFLPLKGTLNL
jgi:glucose-1-phosphate cytidylyltransferase